jgi:hypothetical protein
LTDERTDTTTVIARSPSDGFTPSYLLLVTLVFLLFWYSVDYNLPLVLLWLFIALIVTTVLLVQAILCCLRQQGRRLASVAAAPFLAWALLSSLSHMGIDPHWIRLQPQKRAHLEQ